MTTTARRGDGRVPRRSVLIGLGAAGLTMAGALTGCASGAPPAAVAPAAASSADARALLRRRRFFVAHRGAGDEAPEHTLAAYTRIVDAGAAGVEVSVHSTRDGVLVCHHDPTLERTCAGFPGAIADLTAAELGEHPVDMRAVVGPAWGVQPIPRFEEVLDAIGGRTVLFVEAKDTASVAPMIAAIVDHGLQRSVVLKQYYEAGNERAAAAAGLAVWSYLADTATDAEIAAVAAVSDALGVDASTDTQPDDPAARVRVAVATGKPVIAWPVQRRQQVEQFAAEGVRGFMCSSWTYLAQPGPLATSDGFGTGKVQSGDLPPTQNPESAPRWNTDRSVALANPPITQSLSMGSLGPIAASSYTISLELCFDRLPPDPGQHAGLVIGRADDSQYRFGVDGPGGGQLVILRGNGNLELRLVPPDNTDSTKIVAVPGPPPVAGRWELLVIAVGPTTVTLTRVPAGGRPVEVQGPRTSTGRYFVLTRNYAAPDASVRFRSVRVT